MLIFAIFEPRDAYKGDTYKKKRVLDICPKNT